MQFLCDINGTINPSKLTLSTLKKLLFYTILAFAVASCQKATESPEFDYYNFPEFFESEISRLQNIDRMVLNKNVTMNKVTEQKQMINPDIAEELAIFKKISIKPINWKNLYTLDSAQKLENGMSALYYSTRDKKLEIKQVIITDTMEWKNEKAVYPALNSPFQLLFLLNNSNVLTNSSKKLVYQPSNGFLIKGNQKTILLRGTEYAVRAWWTNN